MDLSTFTTAIRELRSLRDSGAALYTTHYACQSFHKLSDEPPGVSAIAFAEVFSLATKVYSVMDRQAEGEKFVLESFHAFLRDHEDARLVHWNMNSADFGFQALANRYARPFSQEPPGAHSESRLIDLDELIGLGYGRDFADHPRLINIAKLNDFRTQYFLTGKEEADLFDKNEHAKIRRSVSEKVRLLAFLTRKLIDGSLETRHGGQRLEFAGSSIDSVAAVVTVGRRMLDVERQLRRRHGQRPTIVVGDEYDAQDLLNALLRVFFDDIRKEDWSPSYAGSASRVDFVLPRYRLGIELKYARESLTAKQLGEELIIDIERYKIHPSVRHLICLVFDSEGRLNNPRGLEDDLSRPRDGLAVTLRIFDR